MVGFLVLVLRHFVLLQTQTSLLFRATKYNKSSFTQLIMYNP